MTDECHTALMHIRLLLSGAIDLYESAAPEIYEKLQAAEYERLTGALDGMAEALYWARSKAEKALLHEACEPRFSLSTNR